MTRGVKLIIGGLLLSVPVLCHAVHGLGGRMVAAHEENLVACAMRSLTLGEMMQLDDPAQLAPYPRRRLLGEARDREGHFVLTGAPAGSSARDETGELP